MTPRVVGSAGGPEGVSGIELARPLDPAQGSLNPLGPDRSQQVLTQRLTVQRHDTQLLAHVLHVVLFRLGDGGPIIADLLLQPLQLLASLQQIVPKLLNLDQGGLDLVQVVQGTICNLLYAVLQLTCLLLKLPGLRLQLSVFSRPAIRQVTGELNRLQLALEILLELFG